MKILMLINMDSLLKILKKIRSALFCREVAVPFLMLVILFSSSIVFSVFTDRVVFSSMLVDLFVLALSLVCYFRFVWEKDGKHKLKDSGFLFLIFFFAVMWVCTQAAGAYVSSHSADVSLDAYREIAKSDVMLYLFLSVCVAPVSEECLFRGVVYGCFRQRFSKLAAAFVSSLLFAAAHGTMTHLALALVMGMFCAFAFEVTGRLWVPMVFHFLYNALSASYFFTVPDWVTSLPFVVVTNMALFIVLSALYIRFDDIALRFRKVIPAKTDDVPDL